MSAREVLAQLESAGLTLALAESLTGGALANAFVEVPGASKVLRGSIVAYATDLKQSVLGVEQRLLEESGPVDPTVAKQMALGVARALGAKVSVSTTGVAGPDAQGGKPVGLVFIAVNVDGDVHVFEERFTGDRAEIRASAVASAIAHLATLVPHR